jgi:hypothetical protein
VVERLLACGHAVHVLVRPRTNPGPEDVLLYLQVSGGRELSMLSLATVLDMAWPALAQLSRARRHAT